MRTLEWGMSCFFASICNQSERMAQALEPVRDALLAPAPISRWGFGFAQGGEILLSRTPRQHDDGVDIYPAIVDVRSDCVIAHASRLDDLSGNSNTQPFRYRQWMFAQRAQVSERGPLSQTLSAHLPAYLDRHRKGQTVAEVSFYLFLARAHESGCVDDANVTPARLATLLAQAVTELSELAAQTGIEAKLGPLVLSNGRALVAARPLAGDDSSLLSMRRLTVPGPRDERDPSFRGLLILSHDRTPGVGFEEIPAGSCVQVNRDLQVDIAPFA